MQNPSIARTTFNSSKEGIRATLAAMLGISESEVPTKLILQAEQQAEIIDAEKKIIKESIQPHYDELVLQNIPSSIQKLQELICLGRFMHLLKDVSLIACTERPDFIIKHHDRNIGIELTQLHSKELTEVINPLKQILKLAEIALRDLMPHYTALVSLNYMPEGLSKFSKKDYPQIANTIAEYVNKALNTGEVGPLDYIQIISVTEQDTLDLRLSENYLLSDLNTDLLRETINTKEKKHVNYQSESIAACWLLIITDGVSQNSSFNINPRKLPQFQNSPFEYIFLLDAFSEKLYNLC